MPKDKPFKTCIPAIYKKHFEDVAMLFYVMATIDRLPAVPEKTAVKLYLERMGFDEDDYPLQSALVTYANMKKEYLKTCYPAFHKSLAKIKRNPNT